MFGQQGMIILIDKIPTIGTLFERPTPFFADKLQIDNIFPKRFLDEVLKENPETLTNDGCLESAKTCFQENTQNKKSVIEHEDLMGVHTKILFSAMKSSNFIRFLEKLTGILPIIPDPHYRGSGLHITGSGGNLDIHADFNKVSSKSDWSVVLVVVC